MKTLKSLSKPAAVTFTWQVMALKDADVYEIVFAVLVGRTGRDKVPTNLPASDVITKLIKRAVSAFDAESSLLKLEGDYVVVGDIHGNVDDLLRIFEKYGYPPSKNYLFLGDYVDRGAHSIEVLLLLYSLKVLFPNNVSMLRGNHECEAITSLYGFKRDCRRFLSERLYRKFVNSFASLPFAAVLNGAYFCVHGGISPELEQLSDITALDKPMISSDVPLAKDLLWSDPSPSVCGFEESDRGTGYFFDAQVLKEFLKRNELDMLIRSHEFCDKGSDNPIKRCLTIFSSTDYCGFGNDASVAVVSDNGDYQVDLFCPLSDAELKQRRVIIPEWVFTEVKTFKRPLREASIVSEPDAFSSPVCLDECD